MKLLFLLLFPLCVGSAVPTVKPFRWKPAKVTAFSAVQTSTQTTSAAASINITLSSTTAKQLIIVHIRMPATETCTSITDNVGNTYVVGTVHPSGFTRLYQGYSITTVGGATTVTVNFSGATTNKVVGADVYAGGPFQYDTRATGQNGGGTPAVGLTPDLFPSSAGELVVCTVGSNLPQTWGGPTGYTEYNGTEPCILRSAYLLSATTSEACDWTVTAGSPQLSQIAQAFKLKNSSNFFFEP